jgi:hypothetical protein
MQQQLIDNNFGILIHLVKIRIICSSEKIILALSPQLPKSGSAIPVPKLSFSNSVAEPHHFDAAPAPTGTLPIESQLLENEQKLKIRVGAFLSSEFCMIEINMNRKSKKLLHFKTFLTIIYVQQ